ncbi:MAG: hypothetical protein M1832_003168 [Thelocarpon impressellum]|nr:MAG: hypothetical protein M1832_003168 [Thelocarpon impressellum]
MKPSLSTIVAAASLLYTASTVSAQSKPALKKETYDGCYSAVPGMEDRGEAQFQTVGFCQNLTVVNYNKPVMALSAGSNCWTGDELPPSKDKVGDEKCNSKCQGFGSATCGGKNFYAVYLTGTMEEVPRKDESSDSQSSASIPTPTQGAAPSTITQAGQTIVVTAPGSAEATTTPKAKGSGANKAAIAAGVVVGIVGLSALAGGLFLFMRARKRRALEEEYRRNAAISGISGGGKTDSASSVSDSRLEPSVMLQRRMSDGSIADNQDYSRRILKVTNPDGT